MQPDSLPGAEPLGADSLGADSLGAELLGTESPGAEALGKEALAKDLGFKVKVQLMVDSSAAKAIASRSGLGKVRRLEVRHLWVQDATSRGRFAIKKAHGKRKPADVLTKPLGHALCTETPRVLRCSL